ncbi:hypothetical protein GCM10027036_11730 [Flavihumibacter cheonanensis]
MVCKSHNFFYFGYMKILLTTLSFLLIFGNAAFAQKKKSKENFYVFDKNWNGTTLEAAEYMLRVQQRSDTCWQFDYYNFKGPLIKTEQYKDREGKQLHGAARYYNGKGLLDSFGVYVNGKKHGNFYKLVPVDSLPFKTLYVYHEDQLMKTINFLDNDKDNSNSADGKESEYPGGIGSWSKFLSKNLSYPKRAVDLNIQGRVTVFFMVNESGQVIEPFIGKSIEYTLDDESIRMISISGKWIPAVKDGKNVKTYKHQPIVYRLE